MFEQLFGSKTRVKLLSLFLNNPGRSYYVREITRKIDEQINSVRRELANLLSIGIIKSDSTGNRLYYEVDEDYKYYKQLRSIFANIPVTNKVLKETKEEDKIAARLRTAGKIDLAFLTGKFVRDPHISVDICVVGDVNRARLQKVITELEKEHGQELNYTIMSPDEYNYRLNLNDRFLTSLTEAKKITLIDVSDEPEHTDIILDQDAQKVPVNVEDGV